MKLTQNFYVFTLVLFATKASFAWQFDMGNYDKWFQSLEMPKETITQMSGFFPNQSPVDLKTYGDKILATYTQKVSKFMTNLQNGKFPNCDTSININFDDNLTQSKVSEYKNFEDELLQMEAIACLPQLELERTVEVFRSDEFQLKSITGMKTSQSDEANNYDCQSTKVFGVGESNFCSRYSFWRNESTIVSFSVNVKGNPNDSGPVYLRLVTVVFHKLADGRILVYNLTYGRGPKLPFHSIVKSMASKAQSRLMNDLAAAAR